MLDATLLIGSQAELLEAPDQSVVGQPGWPRERWLSALPLEDGPRFLQQAQILVDAGGFAIADPQGYVLGQPAVYVSRLLAARLTEWTR